MNDKPNCWEKVDSDREAIKSAIRGLAECRTAKRWPEWNIAGAALMELLGRLETYELNYKNDHPLRQ